MCSALARLLILFAVVQICASLSNCTTTISTSDDDDVCETRLDHHLHTRAKRWLTMIPYGGIARLAIGFVLPIRWMHNLMHLLNCAYNLQAVYQIPATIIWPLPMSYFKNRLNNDYVDNSRGQLYRLLERILSNLGGNGRACLLRTICEVAETPLSHNGMIGEIFDVVFIPYEGDKIDEAYHQAKLNGQSGQDCAETYKECPLGSGLLEKISLVHYVK